MTRRSEVSRPRSGHCRIPQSTVALQAPHCVQWMKRPYTLVVLGVHQAVPQLTHRKSMVCELGTRMRGASTVCPMRVASTTFKFRVGFFKRSPSALYGTRIPKKRIDGRRFYGLVVAGVVDGSLGSIEGAGVASSSWPRSVLNRSGRGCDRS
jgi:hypothetical protein